MSDKNIDGLRRQFDSRLAQVGSNTFYASVKDVDEQLRICSVDIEGVIYEQVLLYGVENKDFKGLCLIPKIDSIVLVSRIAGSNNMFVELFSEVDKVLLTIGDKVEASIDEKELTYKRDKVALRIADGKIEVDSDKIVFNGGDNKGLIQIEKLTEKVNSFIDDFNQHVHSGVIIAVSGGSGAPAVGATGSSAVPTSPAQKLNKSDYEDTKITH